MMTLNLGILPDAVSRDSRAETALVFGTFGNEVTEDQVKGWLTGLAALRKALGRHQGREAPYGSVVFGLGPRFFTRFPTHVANNPHGFIRPPALPVAPTDFDFMFQVTYTSEARLADFLTGLWATRPVLASLDIEHGYARNDGREVFGQLDGLRNLSKDQRHATISLDRTALPEEPVWLDGGCYGVYLKIEQNTERWTQVDANTREQIIGRHTDDGSRLDHARGTNPKTEGEFADPASPPVNSHVRKAGPRGALHDQNLIFRKGVPYIEEIDGIIVSGLQLVAYQASLDDFDVVLNRWMLNPDFPSPGSGVDALMSPDLVTFKRSALFVVVPDDDRFPAAGYFDPLAPVKPSKSGRIHIRKTAIDQNNNPVNAEVGDIEFQMIDPTTGAPVGDAVRTNPAGRAVLPPVPLNTTVRVRETQTGRFEPAPDFEVLVDRPNIVHEVVNRLIPNVPPYGG